MYTCRHDWSAVVALIGSCLSYSASRVHPFSVAVLCSSPLAYWCYRTASAPKRATRTATAARIRQPSRKRRQERPSDSGNLLATNGLLDRLDFRQAGTWGRHDAGIAYRTRVTQPLSGDVKLICVAFSLAADHKP